MPDEATKRLLEAQVAAARERGDFEQLEGQGKPLELAPLDALSADQRLEALWLRSMGELLPEVVLAREIRSVRKQLAEPLSEQVRARLTADAGSKRDELRKLLKERRAAERKRER